MIVYVPALLTEIWLYAAVMQDFDEKVEPQEESFAVFEAEKQYWK